MGVYGGVKEKRAAVYKQCVVGSSGEVMKRQMEEAGLGLEAAAEQRQ